MDGRIRRVYSRRLVGLSVVLVYQQQAEDSRDHVEEEMRRKSRDIELEGKLTATP